MNLSHWTMACALLVAAGATPQACRAQQPVAPEKTIRFAGYEWSVRDGAEKGGPGPNNWDARNAWVDAQGQLHLKISHAVGPEDKAWSCAEVTLKNRLGFGRYQFQVSGRLDRFDPNTVLGLFNYTTPDVGPDGTNEIDIEFARWGEASKPVGNYTIWPALPGPTQNNSLSFPMLLTGEASTHRFEWSRESVRFQSLHGYRERDDNSGEFLRWLFEPPTPARLIPQHPLPIHLNLWLFRGRAPQDGQPVEVVIRSFSFKPA